MRGGFEVVVRPVVFPNIRPAPARSLPPLDDPDKGFVVIKGNGGKQVDLTQSWSNSSSTSNYRETERRVDKVRVYQKEEDGTVNKDNFVDIEVPNRIKLQGPAGPSVDNGVGTGGEPGQLPPGTASEQRVDYYRPVQEADNVEVKKRNYILRSGEEFSE